MAESVRTRACFLGTGNYLAPGRYWNSFVLDGNILVEPSPTCLPHLRRCGIEAAELDVVVVSHFHPDHTFGWPFLLLELILRHGAEPLFVVGPRGVESQLEEMLLLGGVPDVLAAAKRRLDLRDVEVDGSWQDAGPLRFRAIEVEHVPHLECYGYLFERAGRTIGYSGDTTYCTGLTELAAASDLLILECNNKHTPPAPVQLAHMDLASVTRLRDEHPSVPFVLTHLGDELDVSDLPDVRIPQDFETLEL